MAVHEKWESRSGDGITRELTYEVLGTNDEIAARTELLGAVAAAYDSLPIDIDRTRLERMAETAWLGVVVYGRTTGNPDDGTSEFEFDTTGGQQKRTQADGQETFEDGSGTPVTPDPYEFAIGVDEEGQVNGVDLTIPQFAFGYTLFLNDSVVTAGYIATLFTLTGKVNSTAFKGFAAGEVLFLGATGRKRTGEQWQIHFRFAANENLTNIQIGTILVPSKLGWQLITTHYLPLEFSGSGGPPRMLPRPIQVSVSDVFPYANLNALGV